MNDSFSQAKSVNVPVSLAGRMQRAFVASGERRLTKRWIREYLRDADFGLVIFRNRSHFYPGVFVGAVAVVTRDLTLEVHDDQDRSVALVNMQWTHAREGRSTAIQAVVR